MGWAGWGRWVGGRVLGWRVGVIERIKNMCKLQQLGDSADNGGQCSQTYYYQMFSVVVAANLREQRGLTTADTATLLDCGSV